MMRIDRWKVGCWCLIVLWCASMCAGAQCPNNCLSAYQHGSCNTTDGVCDCTQWWKGDDCAIPEPAHDWDIMNCVNGYYSPPYYQDGLQRYCACVDGWTGITCGQCDSDSVCQNAYNNDTYMCDQSLVIYENKRYYTCTAQDPLFISFLGDGRIAADCQIPQDGVGECFFDAFRTPVGSPLLFNCTFRGCSKSFDGKMQNIHCEESTCICTSQCIELAQSYLSTARTTMDFNCDINTNICYFTQAEIALLDNSPFDCKSTECRSNATFAVVIPPPVADTRLQIGLSVGLGGFFILAIIIALVSCQCCSAKKLREYYEKDIELQTTHIIFKNVSCSIPVESTVTSFGNLFCSLGWMSRISPKNMEDSNRKLILNSVSGECKPGELVAILGPSGSGKTTLLDILSKRKTFGEISGSILVNGNPIDSDFKRVSGYVYQDDVLLETLTVKEHLEYIALLRLPEYMPHEKKMEKVNEVMTDLGLQHIANSRIGSVARRGISGGERKRVSIATEMLVDPPVLFLDEPTSGLDSYYAYTLVKALHDLAKNKQRTIVMSVHQPRANIYQLFDKVCLLSHGRQVYFGAGDKAQSYFETQGHICPPNFTIADYMIDFISEASANDINILVGANQFEVEEPMKPVEDGDIHTPMYSTTPMWQINILLKRAFTNMFRNPHMFRVQYGAAIIIGLIMGWVFWQLTADLAGGGVQNRLGSLFFSCTILTFNSLTAVDLFYAERLLFLRERGNGCYRTSSYFAAKLITEILIMRIVPTMIVAAISYYMIGYRPGAGHFFYYMLLLVEIAVCATTVCMAISAIIPNVGVGNLVLIFLFFLFFLFGGNLVNLTTLSSSLQWLSYFSFIRYGYEGLLINEMDKIKLLFNAPGYPSFELDGNIIIAQLSVDVTMLVPNVFILLGMIVWYIFWTYIFLRFAIRENR